jgi:phosphatidylethanolamine N-methyltransferase
VRAGIDVTLKQSATTNSGDRVHFRVPPASPMTERAASQVQGASNAHGEELRPTQRYGTGLISGERFRVPVTRTMAALVFDVRNWGPLEFVVHALFLVQLFATFWVFPRLDPLCTDALSGSCAAGVISSVMLFLSWRLAYNVGLGWLLRRQSRHAAITHWWAGLSLKWKRIIRRCFRSSLLPDERVASRARYGPSPPWPVDFEAWAAFRCLATIVLANDGWSYLLLCCRVFHFPWIERWYARPDVWLCYLLGVALIAFSLWAKASAHRVVGDFAWYWGDFFFIMEGELTFDGVFELFPHPMYTVGYTAYYGFSLICRSYTLLIASLIAHMSQLLFLMSVEEPHIEKTYGPSERAQSPSCAAESVSPERICTVSCCSRNKIEKEAVVLANLDPFRNSDLSLLIMACMTVFTPALSGWTLTSRYYAMQVVGWMVFHWCGLGTVLYLQSTRRWWTRHFEQRGHCAAEAFRQWQRTFNMSLVMNHLVFVMLALHDAQPIRIPSVWSLVSGRTAALVGGSALIIVGASSSISAYRILGDYGWFYGDFFLEPCALSNHQGPWKRPASVEASLRPSYAGIYRYLNNPDCVLGYLWMYGLSLATESWRAFWFAVCSQALHVLFLVLVEVPHMHRTYGPHCRRAAALELLLRRQVQRIRDQPLLREVTCKVEARVDELRGRLLHKYR